MNQNGPDEIVTYFCPCKPTKPTVCAYCTMNVYKQATSLRTRQFAVFTEVSKQG